MRSHYPTVNKFGAKDGVRFTDALLDPCMVLLLRVLMRTAPELNGATLIITSANDSRHGEGSLHYVGRAFDVRTGYRHPTGGIAALSGVAEHERATSWVARARQQLGPDYDVVAEGNHIHAEYDPK